MLVSGTSILKAKWHDLVAIWPHGVMKEVFSISSIAIVKDIFYVIG